MKKKFAHRIYNNTRRSLKNAEIPFTTRGSGKYLFTTYAVDYSDATIWRFSRLDEMAEAYTARLEASDCHLVIHLRYLSLANLLFDDEFDTGDDSFTYRISYCFDGVQAAAA